MHQGSQRGSMMNKTRQAANVATKACKECQKRKGRCSGGSPCTYCEKSNRPCIYEERPARLPLTRKNVELLEKKCMTLENVLRTLHPEMDIGELLNEPRPPGISRSLVDGLPVGMVRQLDEDNEFIEGYETSVVPKGDYDVLEWHEDVSSGEAMDTFQDGTASFGSSVEQMDNGYIGKSAGASILRVIHKLLDIHRDGINAPLSSSADDSSHETTANAITKAENQLLVRAIRDSLVDSYFRTFNTFYPILHERTFRAQYNNFDNVPENSHFHMLLRMVIAMGSLCGSTEANSNEYCYYLSARSRLAADMLESGTVEQIQILLLMSNYLQKRDKPNTGYNMLGLAVRMAIGMGLHKELIRDSNNAMSTPNTVRMESRRRLWWVLYLFDSGISITFGRPPIMADRAVDVRVPLNIDDSNLKLTDPVPLPSPRATPYTALIAFAKISLISSRMFERFFLRHRPISSALEMAEYMHLVECFDKQLAKWRNDLPMDFYSKDCPDWFRAPRCISLWREQNLRALMYKGMLEAVISEKSRSTLPQDYINRCLGVALSTVSSIGQYIEDNPDNLWWGLTWYATYFLFQADLFLILVMIISYDRETPSTRSSVDKTIQECSDGINRSCDHFRKLQRSNPVSRKCIATLDQIDGFLKRYKAKKRNEPLPDDGDSQMSDGAKDTFNNDWIENQQQQHKEELDSNPSNDLFAFFENSESKSSNQFDSTFLDNLMDESFFNSNFEINELAKFM